VQYIQHVELLINAHWSLHNEGTVTIVLPDFMTALVEEELKLANDDTTAGRPRTELAFAAGRHPRSQEIVFVTGVGEVRSIDTAQFGIPPGKAFPIDHGLTIRIELDGYQGFEVATDWAMRVSQELINLGRMADKRGARVTYVDE
jgi:hypothetical protein